MTKKQFDQDVQRIVSLKMARCHAEAVMRTIEDPVGACIDNEERIRPIAGVRIKPIEISGIAPFNHRAGREGVTYKVFRPDAAPPTGVVVYCGGSSYPADIVQYILFEGDVDEDDWQR